MYSNVLVTNADKKAWKRHYRRFIHIENTTGDQKYVKFGETYYQPIQQNGKSVYEMVIVKQDK